MRKSVKGLCGIIRTYQYSPTNQEVYVFVNKSRTLVKMLHWERGGFVVYYKRLEQGRLSPSIFHHKFEGDTRTCGEGLRRSTVAHFARKVRGDEYCGDQARNENPTKSCPGALAMFATCSWPSLCEQSELQCWRRNRRLCGSMQISAARVLPPTFYISSFCTPMFVSERGSRDERVWVQRRTRLGAETNASGSRGERTRDGVRQKA